jgi:hypothetical protein
MWAVDEGDWPRRVDYYCPACLPDDLRVVVGADEIERG